MKKRGNTLRNKGLIATIVVLVLIVIYGISSYNGLVSAEEDVDNKFSQVDNQLKRRSDLIPNLVETVKATLSMNRKQLIQSLRQERS